MSTRVDPTDSGPARCRGTTKRTGTPCKRYPIPGGTVCKMHGGGAPQVRAKAARNLAEGELRQLLARKYNRDVPITNPLQELQAQAGRVRAWSEFLEDQITQLRHNSQWDTEQVNGIAQLFEGALKELRTILVDMARLKIDERLAAIDEMTATMVLDAMKAGFAAAGVTGIAQSNAIAVTGRHLRIVKGGQADEPRKATGY